MSSKNWYFTADTNAKGYTYIKAYQTEWDPVRKRSRSAKSIKKHTAFQSFRTGVFSREPLASLL